MTLKKNGSDGSHKMCTKENKQAFDSLEHEGLYNVTVNALFKVAGVEYVARSASTEFGRRNASSNAHLIYIN